MLYIRWKCNKQIQVPLISEVFKMLMPLEKGAYDKSIPNPLKLKSELGIRLDPKGHDYQLYKGQVEKDIALYAFSYRVCKLWNSLPKSLIHAKTVKAFEIGLDRHWANQPLMYDNHEASIIVWTDSKFCFNWKN